MTVARYVLLKDIRRRPDARSIDRDNVERIKQSIAEVGLLTPVVIRPAGNGSFELIAGNHRFLATQELGEKDILALDVADFDDLRAEMAMIDENLVRAELSPAERSSQTARRKAIYEELHPEAKHGENLGKARVAKLATQKNAEEDGSSITPSTPSFAAATAAATGQSERAVRRDAERGEKVIPEALKLVRGTKLDTGVYLDKLKRLPPDEQVQTVKRDLAETKRREDTPASKGGIAGRYVDSDAPPMPADPVRSAERFIALADQIEAIPVADLVTAGRLRATVGQRADGLATLMDEIKERLNG